MVRFHRSSITRNGKYREGIRFAIEVAAYINSHYAPYTVQAFIDTFGNFNALHWYADFPDLAALEKMTNSLATDQGYWSIIDKAADLFVDGSTQDQLVTML